VRSCVECGLTYRTLVPRCGLDGGEIVQTDRDPLIGRSIDRYSILERLGEGGYAVLYRVRDEANDREAALKLLLGEMACLPLFAERFRREALAMGRIDHPNVAVVYDFSQSGRGLTYLVMELLEGRLLAKELAGGRFDRERAIRIAIGIARGLEAAHAVGCIHRDVTPRNIMLAGDHAKLFDFGLVALQMPDDDSRSQVKLTELGTVVGTPEYVAPEVGFGHPATPSSDLYSLGVVIYEMLNGLPPFVGRARDIFAAHIIDAVPPFGQIGPLEALVMELLERKPAKRPASAAVVAERLAAL
jgi:eukaryotic-like serine/threonine-protein kinase